MTKQTSIINLAAHREHLGQEHYTSDPGNVVIALDHTAFDYRITVGPQATIFEIKRMTEIVAELGYEILDDDESGGPMFDDGGNTYRFLTPIVPVAA